MGSTYETDEISAKEMLPMTIRAAGVMKSLGNLIGCRSWLQARLAMNECGEKLGEINEIIVKGREE